MSAAGLSGTSIGTVASSLSGQSHDPALVAGTPRPIRSDEWNVTTPLVVAQSHHGYPRTTVDGVGSHDLSANDIDIPNTDWSTFFKPWNLPPLVLDIEHGFAARWWMMSLVLLLGAYLLLLAITDRTLVAVLFSLGLWLSPFFHWWYLSVSLDSVGMGMLALGAFLYALRARTPRRRAGWIALTIYATVGFALILYPPFQIPMALVMVAVGLGEIAGGRAEGDLPWRRTVTVVGVSGLTVLAILGVYYLHARPAFNALNNTVYPGHRRVSGGDVSLLKLLSAPFGLSLARRQAIAPTLGNLSEISSFIILGPFMLFQLQRVRLREFADRTRAILIGLGVVFVVLSAWYLFSLPPFIARVLQLDRVEATRAVIGIGAAGILMAAVFCSAPFRSTSSADAPPTDSRRRQATERRRRITTGAVVCGSTAFGAYFWAGRGIRTADPTIGLSLWTIGAVSAATGVIVLLLAARKAVLGGAALVVFSAFLSLPVNPLYRGVGPLQSAPLLASIDRVAATPHDARHRVWISYNPGSALLVIASGVPTLNGVDIYPSATAWRILAPNRRSELIWNRYANIYFSPGPAGSPASLQLLDPDVIMVTVDPCGREASELGVGFVVSTSPLSRPCLVQKVHGAGTPSSPDIYERR